MGKKHKNYEAPLCEVIEVELEGAVLSASDEGTMESIIEGGGIW